MIVSSVGSVKSHGSRGLSRVIRVIYISQIWLLSASRDRLQRDCLTLSLDVIACSVERRRFPRHPPAAPDPATRRPIAERRGDGQVLTSTRTPTPTLPLPPRHLEQPHSDGHAAGLESVRRRACALNAKFHEGTPSLACAGPPERARLMGSASGMRVSRSDGEDVPAARRPGAARWRPRARGLRVRVGVCMRGAFVQ